MRAAVVTQLGGPEAVVIREVERPSLRPGTVRVAVSHAALNFPDLLIMAGRYRAKVDPPYVPGCEFSGTVLEVADGVSEVAPGDTVFGPATHGALAEEVVIDAPAGHAGADRPRHGPADPRGLRRHLHDGLPRPADLRSGGAGEWVTVLGAAGGVGLAAVDIAGALGARTVAVARGHDRLEVCRQSGADVLVDYSTSDVKQAVKDATGGGADVIIDPVGGDWPSRPCGRCGGAVVMSSSGSPPARSRRSRSTSCCSRACGSSGSRTAPSSST
uniref:Zinc-binding dehydrogenase n=1 Tax=Janibacter limosus TaxID=53458 RepID=A0AC61U614_9MICO|nr:zinc-binding dehydrogenase [Janibacter limosus]